MLLTPPPSPQGSLPLKLLAYLRISESQRKRGKHCFKKKKRKENENRGGGGAGEIDAGKQKEGYNRIWKCTVVQK
jgi:hypothetical protein